MERAWSWHALEGRWGWEERDRVVLGALERPLGCIIEVRLGGWVRLQRVLNAKLTLDSVLWINGFHT